MCLLGWTVISSVSAVLMASSNTRGGDCTNNESIKKSGDCRGRPTDGGQGGRPAWTRKQDWVCIGSGEEQRMKGERED